MPQRCQRRRSEGWRLPENTVIVDRSSRFGNPFTIADAIEANYEDPRSACCSHYKAWMDGDPAYPDVITVGRRTFDRRWVWANLHKLRGKNVCCTCATDKQCHGDDIIHRANGGAA